MSDLEKELKVLLIETLDLEDVNIEDINSEEALFGEGLGLDSIDALELGLALQKKYAVKVQADSEETKQHFASIKNLARFVETYASTS